MAKPPKPPAITVLKRRSIAPLSVTTNDKVIQENNTQFLQEANYTAAITFNEAIIFETVFEGRKAVGGFLLEQP